MFSTLVIDTDLIRKYGGAGPRYTSYPTADRFVEAFNAQAYGHWLENRNIGGFVRPLSLYVHLPFCDTICYYCACNKIVTRDRSRAARYVMYLRREMALVGGHLGNDRTLGQVHWGGGTPTFLSDAELAELAGAIRSEFTLDPKGEYAIEIDPRRVTPERVALLARLGFNRLSLGVQDFDREVQLAVNRVQTVEETETVLNAARDKGFRSVNIDLIYGLPKQSVDGFSRTLDRVIECYPDRIALYSYAHLPSVFKPQRRINAGELPLPEVKLQLLTLAVSRLREAGYVYIGMDHFARPNDDLAVAQRKGRLTRNFQGYSSAGECDIVALGVSAISTVGPIYAQNTREIEDYYARLDQGVLPVWRGVELTADDLVRRAVIQSLACHFQVSKESISIAHIVDFDSYFAPELEHLRELERDGLVKLEEDWISVTPEGRLLVRAVCMVFDRYLRAERTRASYSRVM
ncbi:MAG: oxygen-independent coproporphyrinogen III oxidase [Betaproteobacteria bacterium RIFCSPLOWO2_12_FULL_66_14]|nr:MAG: oxygen-independent coproporphyrinogen III oxidase [Betaproteobacteria bacterium RIFCSPLOWO2_12_FULL_66_14]